MATSSTIPTVKAALVAAFQNRPGLSTVKVSWSWAGPASKEESIFLARAGSPMQVASRVPNIMAGRKQRQEDYTIPLTLWSFKAGSSASTPEVAEGRAFEMFAEVDGTLADDPSLGLTPTIQQIVLGDYTVDTLPYENGWASEIVAELRCAARLT